jgi:hypothetical protein
LYLAPVAGCVALSEDQEVAERSSTEASSGGVSVDRSIGRVLGALLCPLEERVELIVRRGES